MTLNQFLEKMVAQTSANHWFKNKGLSFVDIYDVIKKLTHIHGVTNQWIVMPFLEPDYFVNFLPQYCEKWRESKRFLAIPAGTGRHWTHILVDRKDKVIEHWDSVGNRKAFNDPITQFKIKIIASYISHYFLESYRIVNQVKICHQYRDKNCGLYTIRFMEEKMKGLGSKNISMNLNYDIESYKSRFHWIRCSSLNDITSKKRYYQRQLFCSKPQYQKLPKYSYSRILFQLLTQ